MTFLFRMNRCAGWVWYVQCDLTLYVIMAVFAVLTFKKSFNRYILFVLLMVLSSIISGFMLYLDYKKRAIVDNDIIYREFYFRMGLYMAGGMLGYYYNEKKAERKIKEQKKHKREENFEIGESVRPKDEKNQDVKVESTIVSHLIGKKNQTTLKIKKREKINLFYRRREK